MASIINRIHHNRLTDWAYTQLHKKPDYRNKIVFPDCVKIQSTEETLSQIEKCLTEKRSGAYLRFGDGDVRLMGGHDDLLQKANMGLSNEMKEAFNLGGKGIIKTLPLHSAKYGLEPGMMPGFHGVDDNWATEILKSSFEYFVGQKIYSHVALSYVAVVNEKRAVSFLQILKKTKPILIGNEEIPERVAQQLFGKKVLHVKTPSKNSYEHIDEAERQVCNYLENNDGYQVVVLAMGCSGRVMAKRIYKKYPNKVYIFDFGSLMDILCGWNTRAWINLSGRDEKYWQEFLEMI